MVSIISAFGHEPPGEETEEDPSRHPEHEGEPDVREGVALVALLERAFGVVIDEPEGELVDLGGLFQERAEQPRDRATRCPRASVPGGSASGVR